MVNGDLIIPKLQELIGLFTVIVLPASRVFSIYFAQVFIGIDEDMIVLTASMHLTFFVYDRMDM